MTTRSPAIFLVALSLLCAATLPAQSIFTIAGGGTDDGRPATVAAIGPAGVAVDSTGNLYIADFWNHRIRKVAAANGIITTVAGNGSYTFGGDGGAAIDAGLNFPQGVAVDAFGDIYIADSDNHRIRKVAAASGIITTIAGASSDLLGDGGAATAGGLLNPSGVAFDFARNLYIADRGHHRIRRVDAESGIITTVAGNGSQGFGGDGGAATAAALNEPHGVTVDSAGNLYIADSRNGRIRRVAAGSSIITTVAGNGSEGSSGDGGPATAAQISRPKGVALDSAGNLYIANWGNPGIRKVEAGSGIITTVAVELQYLDCVALDSAGNLYIADWSHRIRKVESDNGIITTVAGNGSLTFTGDGGPAVAAGLSFPRGVALDSFANLYIADYSNHRIRRVAGGTITTIAGNGSPGFHGDGGAAVAAGLAFPADVALDSLGNLYIADSQNIRIRRIDSRSRIITTVAGSGSRGFSGDGGAATEAELSDPNGVALDSLGNLYFADTQNFRIRKVDFRSGIITTVAGSGSPGFSGDGGAATAAELSYPDGVALDSLGNLYFADTGNNRIRRVAAASGTITTVAGNGFSGFGGDGGAATEARLEGPHGVALDSVGNLYIADSYNFRTRRVAAVTGVITTVAGNGSLEFHGDGGAATAAGLNVPYDVTVDPIGNLYIADSVSDRVRAVFACVEIAMPTLTSPANGSTGVATVPRLAWETVKGAFRYDVYLDTVSPPRTIVAPDITTTTYAPANLEPLTTYHWKVVAKGDPFCSPFRTAESPVWSFTTTGACQAPGAIVP